MGKASTHLVASGSSGDGYAQSIPSRYTADTWASLHDTAIPQVSAGRIACGATRLTRIFRCGIGHKPSRSALATDSNGTSRICRTIEMRSLQRLLLLLLVLLLLLLHDAVSRIPEVRERQGVGEQGAAESIGAEFSGIAGQNGFPPITRSVFRLQNLALSCFQRWARSPAER